MGNGYNYIMISKVKELITTATHKDVAIPYRNAFTALSFIPAPIFCATNADIDWENADGTSIIKPHTFSATPTPADANTSIELTIV